MGVVIIALRRVDIFVIPAKGKRVAPQRNDSTGINLNKAASF